MSGVCEHWQALRLVTATREMVGLADSAHPTLETAASGTHRLQNLHDTARVCYRQRPGRAGGDPHTTLTEPQPHGS
jgi:hypothetical protein